MSRGFVAEHRHAGAGLRRRIAPARRLRRGELPEFQALAGGDVIQETPFGARAAARAAAEEPPEHQRIHRPGVVGVFMQAPADGRGQGVEGGPVIAGKAAPEAIAFGDIVAGGGRGWHVVHVITLHSDLGHACYCN